MKKNLQKLILSPLIFCLLLCFTVSPVYASEDNVSSFEPTPLTLTVMGVNENEDAVYLTNDCIMSQSEFHKYSGEEFDLEYGDVIKVYYCWVLETYPCQFAWGEKSKIEYLGKAADYFENKKELVVTKISNDRITKPFVGSDGTEYLWQSGGRYIITFEDSDGTEYLWQNNSSVPRYMPYGLKRVGCKTPSEFDPELINVGDKLLCVLSTEKFYEEKGVVSEKECVYLPVAQVESADNSETFSVANLVFMQKYLTHSYKDSIQKFSNYDINGDGAVNVFDVIILRRMILSNKFYIY